MINRFTKSGMLTILIIAALLLTGCMFSHLLEGIIPSSTGGGITNFTEDENIPEFAEQEVLVKIYPGTDVEEVVSKVEGTIIETIPQLSAYRVKLPSQISITEALQTLEGLEGVEYAEPNRVRYMHLIPDDEFYANKQWGPQRIGAEDAWEVTTGAEGVIIAITDTGVDGTHPDLWGKVIAGFDTFNETVIPEGTNSDVYGHGTHCSGIAAAVSNNGAGIAGLAWDCPIMPIKICIDSWPYWAYDWDMAEAYVWAANNGADVISTSFGGKGYTQIMKDAIDYAVIDNGCVVVVSMGNSATDETFYPAGYQSVIAVGATNAHDKVAYFSTAGDHMSVSAPGVEIYSTVPYSTQGQYYVSWSGTSMSAPHVAGAAALILSQNPGMSPEEVKTQLEETAVDLGDAGFDPIFGHGRIDLAAAVGAIQVNDYGRVDVLITDGSSIPLSGASVIIWQEGAVISTTNSDENGWARFEYINAGDYGISVSLSGYNSSLAADNSVTVVAGAATTITIVLTP